MAARDLFDPTRFSNCCSSVDTGLTNMTKIANREKNSFNKILDKVEKINSSSPFVKKAKELVNVSNRIYENGKIPDKFAQGITGVLDHFGAASILKVVEKVDINAVNNVKTTMGNVSDKLRGGNLRLKDMDGLISDVTRLQKYAKGLFGSKDGGKPNDCVCHPEVYARHIANEFAPKYASLYAVRFHIRPEFAEYMRPDDPAAVGFEFLCTKITRPSIEYDMEEINRYNQRVFVQKKASYGPLTCDFLDDDKNYVLETITRIMSYYTPAMSLKNIANNSNVMNFGDAAEYNADVQNFFNAEGLASSRGPEYGSGGIGVEITNMDFSPLISKIEIFHMHKFGQHYTLYTIYNPVLKSVNFSELSSDSSDMPSITCEFNVTNFNIDDLSVNDVDLSGKWDFSWNRGNVGGTVLGNYDGKINTRDSVLKLLNLKNTPKTKSLKERLKESAKKFAKALADKVKSWAKKAADQLKNAFGLGENGKVTGFIKTIKSGVDFLKNEAANVKKGLADGAIRLLDGGTSKILESISGTRHFDVSSSPATATFTLEQQPEAARPPISDAILDGMDLTGSPGSAELHSGKL